MIAHFETGSGRDIYTFSLEAFSSLVANIYLIDDGNQLILVDCGSGMEKSNQGLLAGFAALHDQFGLPDSPAGIQQILITHGHIDHFGGLPFVRQFSQAPIGVHILDRQVLANHEERVVVASSRLETFLERAGVPAGLRQTLMGVYLFAKNYYRSTPVQFLLEEGQAINGDIGVYHVPGHCPGQVCLQVDDILLTADHILSRTTPHQAPESITLNMGLGHYLDSLTKIEKLPNIRLALGGHEQPMSDVPGRIAAIKQAHQHRLEKILAICHQPKSISTISQELFGQVSSYHVLLALEEAGAHVEYLYQRGELVVANVAELEQNQNAVLQYLRS